MKKAYRLGLGMALLLAATVRCSSEDDSGGGSLVGKTVDRKSLLVGTAPQTVSLGVGKRGATVVFPAGVTRAQTPITVNLNDGVRKRGATVGGPVVEIATEAVAFEMPAKMRQPLPTPPVGKSYVAVSAQKNGETWAIKRGGVRIVPAGGEMTGGQGGMSAGQGGMSAGQAGMSGGPGGAPMVDAGVIGPAGAGGRSGAGGVAVDPGTGGVPAAGGSSGRGGVPAMVDAGVPQMGGIAGLGGSGGTDPVGQGGIAGGIGGAASGGTTGGAGEVGGASSGGTTGSAGASGGTAGTSQSTFTQLATDGEVLVTYEIDILGTGYWGIALEDDATASGTVPYAFAECLPAAKLVSCGFSFMPSNIDPCSTLTYEEAICYHQCMDPATCAQLQAANCGTIPPDPMDPLTVCMNKCDSSRNDPAMAMPCGSQGEVYYEHNRCDGIRDCSDGADELDCTAMKPQVILYCPDGQRTQDGQGSGVPGSTMTSPASTSRAAGP